jgi:2-oxoglutarate-Fe(II)-dependent oxygenase superfamily protein
MKAIATTRDNDLESLCRGRLRLPYSLEKLSVKYERAKPCKHIVVDQLFPDTLIERLVDEMPEINEDNWVCHDDEHLVKYNLRSAVLLGKNGEELTAFLHSAVFLYFLSELTGIRELLPDPYLQGAGFHVIPSGGKFDVHVDRNTAYDTGLIRRLGLIIYLNKDWAPEYGGQLELWNSDGSYREASIVPSFNRTIIFELTDQNFHGVSKVTAPMGRSRYSFAVYFHTACLNSARALVPHASIYGPACYRNRYGVRDMIKDVTPPVLLRALKRVREKNK